MLTRTGYGRRAYLSDAARNPTGWVLTDASLDLDFTNDRYFDGEIAALADILSVSRSTTGTYRNSSGIIQTAAANTARVDHGSGLLIEEQRTNLAVRSNEMDNSLWNKIDMTVDPDVGTFADGTQSFDKIIRNSGATNCRVQQGETFSANTAYTLSFFVKYDSVRYIKIELFGAGESATAIFDLVQNQIVSTSAIGWTNVSAQMVPFANGIYRIILTATSSALSPSTAFRFVISEDLADTITGDGVSGTFVGGAQLEQGSFVTSYIPSVGATTRNADNVQIGTLGAWYNATEGGIYAEADTTNWGSDNHRPFMIQGSTSNRMEMKNNGGSGTKFEVRTGNSRVVEEFPGTPSGVAKFAARYKADDYAIVLDGGVPETDTNAGVPSVSVINLGTFNNASEHLNGHLKRFALFTTTPDNVTLQNLTS